jgi:hypothetical protein
MLMKADGNDTTERTFRTWRAILPQWNVEADRYRRLAIAARCGADVPTGTIPEAEALTAQIRSALERSDMLMTMTLAGDPALSSLLRAGSEFEALLESFQTSIDMLTVSADRPQGRTARVISHADRFAAATAS